MALNDAGMGYWPTHRHYCSRGTGPPPRRARNGWTTAVCVTRLITGTAAANGTTQPALLPRGSQGQLTPSKAHHQVLFVKKLAGKARAARACSADPHPNAWRPRDCSSSPDTATSLRYWFPAAPPAAAVAPGPPRWCTRPLSSPPKAPPFRPNTLLPPRVITGIWPVVPRDLSPPSPRIGPVPSPADHLARERILSPLACRRRLAALSLHSEADASCWGIAGGDGGDADFRAPVLLPSSSSSPPPPSSLPRLPVSPPPLPRPKCSTTATPPEETLITPDPTAPRSPDGTGGCGAKGRPPPPPPTLNTRRCSGGEAPAA